MDFSDIGLIQAIAQKDEKAFEILVNKYQKIIFSFVYRYLGDRCIAEDLTQEVFLRIYKSASCFIPQANAKVLSWIFKIAYNLIINEYKRQKRYNEACKSFYLTIGHAVKKVFSPIEKISIQKDIMDMVNDLPKNQKAALLLKVNHGLSYNEISEIMEVSVSSVESFLFRARKKLKKAMETSR